MKLTNCRTRESAEQDQTACMYMLILLNTRRKINPRSRTEADEDLHCGAFNYQLYCAVSLYIRYWLDDLHFDIKIIDHAVFE